jgi:hypothetical protein
MIVFCHKKYVEKQTTGIIDLSFMGFDRKVANMFLNEAYLEWKNDERGFLGFSTKTTVLHGRKNIYGLQLL